MNNLLRAEMVVLFLGWLSSLLFLFYSEGIFDLSHQWSSSDIDFLVLALVFAVPYALAGLFCWQFKRFSVLFLIGSVVMIIASTGAYCSAYFPQPYPGAEWMFFLVPAGQFFSVCVFSAIVFILERKK